MTDPDLTFRKLRQTPYNDLWNIMLKSCEECSPYEWPEKARLILEKHGWTIDEWQEYNHELHIREGWIKDD